MRILGWNVLSWGFDWRMSLITEAAKVIAGVQVAFGKDPFWIVAHSQGGLLARAVYAQLVGAGNSGQLAGLVTICTPQWGSFEIVRLFNRLPFTYRALVLATGWRTWHDGSPGPLYLDEVIASHPGAYELLPFAGAGPLFDSDPAQAAALYTTASYVHGNPFLVPNLFTTATAVQTVLQTAIPAGKMTTIIGSGERTAYSLSGSAPPNKDAGYLYTDAGDGIVTVAEATLPGVPTILLPVQHALAPLRPSVWLAVKQLISP